MLDPKTLMGEIKNMWEGLQGPKEELLQFTGKLHSRETSAFSRKDPCTQISKKSSKVNTEIKA